MVKVLIINVYFNDLGCHAWNFNDSRKLSLDSWCVYGWGGGGGGEGDGIVGNSLY